MKTQGIFGAKLNGPEVSLLIFEKNLNGQSLKLVQVSLSPGFFLAIFPKLKQNFSETQFFGKFCSNLVFFNTEFTGFGKILSKISKFIENSRILGVKTQ